MNRESQFFNAVFAWTGRFYDNRGMETLLAIGFAVLFALSAASSYVFWRKAGAGEKTLAELESVCSGMEAQLAELKVKAAIAEERASGAEANRVRLEAEVQSLRSSLEDSSRERAKVAEELSAARASLNENEKGAEEARQRYADLKAELDQQRRDAAVLADAKAQAEKRLEGIEKAREEEKRGFEARMNELKELKTEMEGVFSRISGAALERNSESFLKLAKENLGKLTEQNAAELAKRQQAVAELLKPVQEAVVRVGQSVEVFDKGRVESFAQMAEKMEALRVQEESLRKQTQTLGEALRKPGVRGAWGEMQLKRVVEFAGLVERCHFAEQVSTTQSDRPDMIVDLPNGMRIVVDAKAPMDAYLRAVDETDSAKLKEHLENHAKQIRERAKLLGQKKYTDNIDGTPDFTVLFLPSEGLFSTALSVDPELLDFAIKGRIIIATPTTLIALLMTVSIGWKERTLADNAVELKKECAELYKRLCTFLDHYSKVGKELERAINAYNDSVGSMQSKLLVQGRRINELGAFDDNCVQLDKATPNYVETCEARQLRAPELES